MFTNRAQGIAVTFNVFSADEIEAHVKITLNPGIHPPHHSNSSLLAADPLRQTLA